MLNTAFGGLRSGSVGSGSRHNTGRRLRYAREVQQAAQRRRTGAGQQLTVSHGVGLDDAMAVTRSAVAIR